MSSIEMWKMPLIELSNKLSAQLNEKNQEINDSFDKENLLTNRSLIQNRLAEVEGFRRAIDFVQGNSDFMAGFKRDYEAISGRIAEIKVNRFGTVPQ